MRLLFLLKNTIAWAPYWFLGPGKSIMDSETTTNVDSSSEVEFFLEKQPLHLPRQRQLWPWMLSTALFAFLSLGLIIKQSLGSTHNHCTDAQASTTIVHQLWKRSDLSMLKTWWLIGRHQLMWRLVAAREIIELEDVQFHGCHGSDSKAKFESFPDSNLDYLSLIKEDGPCWGDYKAVSFLISWGAPR